MGRLAYGTNTSKYYRVGWSNSTFRKVAYGTEPVQTLMYKISSEGSIVQRVTSTVNNRTSYFVHTAETYLSTKYTNSQMTCSLSFVSTYNTVSSGVVCTGGITLFKSIGGFNSTASRTIQITHPSAKVGSVYNLRIPTVRRTISGVRTIAVKCSSGYVYGSFTGLLETGFFQPGTSYSTTSHATSSTGLYNTATVITYYTNY